VTSVLLEPPLVENLSTAVELNDGTFLADRHRRYPEED
jgi:hypothetical protein